MRKLASTHHNRNARRRVYGESRLADSRISQPADWSGYESRARRQLNQSNRRIDS